MTLEDKLKTVIRDVPDFPKPGILLGHFNDNAGSQNV